MPLAWIVGVCCVGVILLGGGFKGKSAFGKESETSEKLNVEKRKNAPIDSDFGSLLQ